MVYNAELSINIWDYKRDFKQSFSQLEKNQTIICDILNIIIESEKFKDSRYYELVMNTLDHVDSFYNNLTYDGLLKV